VIKAEIGKQLMMRINDKVGTLAEVTGQISACKLNIIAMCAYAIDNIVAIMFVTTDNNEARKILEGHGYQVQEEEIILVTIDNKPGSLQKISDSFAKEGVNLKLMYGSTSENDKLSRLVFISDDNADAMMVLNMKFARR